MADGGYIHIGKRNHGVHTYEAGDVLLSLPAHVRRSPFYEELVRAADLHARKNLNYAGGGADPFRNFRACEAFGVPAWRGVLVRLSDKWMRLCNLADGIEDKVGEPMLDTVRDLAIYALILACLLGEPDGEDVQPAL